MNKLLRIILNCINNPLLRFNYLCKAGFFNKVPDKEFLKKVYKLNMGMELDLDDPKMFNEKLQWLKLHDRKPIYTTMVDKYAVKHYVAGCIGEEYVIPTLGIWDTFDKIDFDSLPNRFVLKCTHDSGGLVICRDKSMFDKKSARKKVEKCLKQNYYWTSREWPYKDVKPRIIAEQYMYDKDQITSLTDYKFYCFNGEPKFLYVSQGLEDHSTASISFLTLDWQFAPYERSDFKPFSKLPEKPKKLDQMIDIAKKLSMGIDFLRVDLYEINDSIYFSELTFSPCAGFMPFSNPEHDLEIGNMLKLTSKVNDVLFEEN